MSNDQRQADTATEILKELVDRLGLTVDIEAREKEGNLVVKLQTAEPGRLIGRKGRYIDSLEYLLNRILGHREEEFPRVMLDVDGYQKQEEQERPQGQPQKTEKRAPRQENKAVRLARDAAKEVKRWGEAKSVGPYSPEDRQAVHDALRDDAEIRTADDPDAPDSADRKKVIIQVSE